MVFEKVRMKKGVGILEVMIVILISVFAIGAMMNFLIDNANEAGTVVDQRYNNSFNQLKAQEGNVSELTDNLKSAANNITEPDNALQVAFAGLKGAWQLVKLPITLVSIASETFNLFLDMIDWIPATVRNTAFIIITLVVLFAVIRLIFNRGNDA